MLENKIGCNKEVENRKTEQIKYYSSIAALPPQSAFHETTIEMVVKENQNLRDEKFLLQEKLRHKEEECQIVREMYHDCYSKYVTLIDSIKRITEIVNNQKSESSNQ